MPSYHIAVELLAVHMFVCVAHTEDYMVELPRLALGQFFLFILRHAAWGPEAEPLPQRRPDTPTEGRQIARSIDVCGP